MAWCLTAPSHYLYQVDIPSTKSCHSFQDNVYLNAQDFNSQVLLEIHSFEITAISPRGQWVQQSFGSTKTPHTSPSQVNCGVQLVIILEYNDHVIRSLTVLLSQHHFEISPTLISFQLIFPEYLCVRLLRAAADHCAHCLPTHPDRWSPNDRTFLHPMHHCLSLLRLVNLR